MNAIKLKIEEIGLSQREISVRLGKNASYLAGVFRSGLSTAKQAELLERLEVVAGGGTILSDEKLLKLADDQLENSYARNEQLEAQLLVTQDSNSKNLKRIEELIDLNKGLYVSRREIKKQLKFERNVVLPLVFLISVSLILWGAINGL